MNLFIEKELNEFKQYHKNIYNVWFHIVCGFIFMVFMILSVPQYSNITLVLYSILLLVTLGSIAIPLVICIVLFVMQFIFARFNLTPAYCMGLFVLFYFLPDLSHYLTNEPPMMDINNITPFTVFVNIFYLLPFSLICLTDPR